MVSIGVSNEEKMSMISHTQCDFNLKMGSVKKPIALACTKFQTLEGSKALLIKKDYHDYY